MTKFNSKNIIYGNNDDFNSLDHDPTHGACWGCMTYTGNCGEGPDCDTVAATIAYCQANTNDDCVACSSPFAGEYQWSEWWCGGSGESGGFTATTCTDDYVDPAYPSQTGCGADFNCTWVAEGTCSDDPPCGGNCTYTCEEYEGQNIYIGTHTNKVLV